MSANTNTHSQSSHNWTVRSHDHTNNRLEFILENGNKKGWTILNLSTFPDYRRVSPSLFINTYTKELNVIQEIHNRLITIIDGVVYRRMSQYEFDQYCHTSIAEENDNGLVFDILTQACNKL